MAVQYETKATNVGGRKGHVQTDDNAINVDCRRLCIMF